ncbi:MAG: DNA repair protein RecN [Bacteroidales bacterium]|nr:DNA repair protein RecN [Bacteroidales bacterium]
MLKSLYIKNYALIHELDIEFNSGLAIISGETGAGKSILLGALSLILGQRADTQVLLDKTSKCIVEGSFEVGAYHLEDFFLENDIDYDSRTNLRREINIAGKSRAFVNDTPVPLTVLKELGMQLVDIHSQHNNILLGDNQFQLQVIDAFVGSSKLLDTYKKDLSLFKNLESEFVQLKEKNDKAQTDLDYFQFQYDQLDSAKLMEGEQLDLENEQDLLTHSEEIGSSLEKISQYLEGEGDDILDKMRAIRLMLERMKEYFAPASEMFDRFESTEIELRDLASEIDSAKQDIVHEPGRLEIIAERLSLLYSLEQKHNVKTVEDLIEIQAKLLKDIENIATSDKDIELREKDLKDRKVNLFVLAKKISEKRKKVIPIIEKEISGILHQLGMPNARYAIDHRTTEFLSTNGIDQVDFMFSANKNSRLQDLKKVASGGELSRVMLSLKSLIAKSVSMPTIIFDEIDSGVSGDIADRVGEIISKMSGSMQVINITHLPQIASKGNQHFLVYKTDEENITRTHLRLLGNDERVMEIAKMLSGKDLSEAAIENARILLNQLKT